LDYSDCDLILTIPHKINKTFRKNKKGFLLSPVTISSSRVSYIMKSPYIGAKPNSDIPFGSMGLDNFLLVK